MRLHRRSSRNAYRTGSQPVLPTAWEGCTIVLLIDGEWPSPCIPPASVPPACFGPDALCYADAAHVVILGASPFQPVLAARRWPAGQPHVTALRARIAAAVARDSRFMPQPLAESAVRATDGVGWASVWSERLAVPRAVLADERAAAIARGKRVPR